MLCVCGVGRLHKLGPSWGGLDEATVLLPVPTPEKPRAMPARGEAGSQHSCGAAAWVEACGGQSESVGQECRTRPWLLLQGQRAPSFTGSMVCIEAGGGWPTCSCDPVQELAQIIPRAVKEYRLPLEAQEGLTRTV